MSTFDLSFDHTFQDVLITPDPAPVQTGCRKDGVYLTWLTLQGGWQYWLFEGPVVRGQLPESKGQAKQAGLIRHTRKETAQSLTLHTANLTEAEADAVGTIRESISVYWLFRKADDSVVRIPVTVPAADADLWNSQTYTNNFQTQIILPSRRSQLL